MKNREQNKKLQIYEIYAKCSQKLERIRMKQKKFIQKSREYQKELKKFIRANFGKKCGHIGKDEISLDCPI